MKSGHDWEKLYSMYNEYKCDVCNLTYVSFEDGGIAYFLNGWYYFFENELSCNEVILRQVLE